MSQRDRSSAAAAPKSRVADITRRYAIRTAITAVLAAAAWYAGIRPMERSIAEDRIELERHRAELTADAASEESLVQARERVASLRDRVISLAEWTERAGNRSNAYDAFRQLAAGAEVRIIRIEPKGQFVLAGRGASKEPVGEVFGHGVYVSGGFREIAAFLDRLEHDLGSSRVLSFRLAPVRGATAVEASIDTSHVALNTRGLRALLSEAAASPTEDPR